VAAARQLREREEYFRAISDHLSDVIAILSRDHVVTYLSASVERVLGLHRDEQTGRIFPEAFHLHPDDRARLSAALAELSSNDRFEPIECRFQHENGRWRTFEIAGTNLLGNEQIRGFLINLRDITDRKQMEQELAQLSRLTSLGRLAAQIAHEFNNVLMGIQPIVEVIRRRPDEDPALLRFADLISSSIARGKRITSDILRFGRPAQLTLRPVAVLELIRQVADEIRPSLPQGIALALSAGKQPLFVLADPAQLVQVLVNLALNAKDAMRDGGGTLAISVRRAEEGDIVNAGRFAHFELSDTGSGIAPEDLPYIFEPLFTTKKSGTGLGLSVVLQIVAAHGGHIGVDSEAGRGTTFHLFIPCAPPPGSVQETERVSTPSPQRLRVLVVEDDDPVASGLRWMLENEGFAVRVVGKGADVLPAISEYMPEIVVLDLGLPDEDGQSVYERIAAAGDLPVIFSSGHASEGEIEKLVDSSRTAFLMKPYSTDELLRAIQRLVAKKPADE
jgi:two-component system, cell cycle sensor histidine kinase and response regulator CckA